jgi:6-phosphogluconolactonase
MLIEKLQPRDLDERRKLIIPGETQLTIIFCVEHFILLAKQAIKERGAFFVALSGGSTPKAIFELLTHPPYDQMVEWGKIHLFWSDERSVPPDHPDSNYHMAMQAGLSKMPIPEAHIHRMCAEEKIADHAAAYEQKIVKALNGRGFDLVMLGMGEDGHTASLFPHTEGLKVENRQVIANYIPDKKTWRMTLTFDCINQAENIAIYVLGSAKKNMLVKVLFSHDQWEHYPVQRVGTPTHRALWIADVAAAEEIIAQKERS